MEEFWFILEIETTAPIALVLDASDNVEAHWSTISHLARELLETLPKTMQPTVYFLGNSEPYTSSDFARQGGRWYQANSRRASLIGPIFEQLEGEGEKTIVVLGNSRIFDLEDWLGTTLLEHTLFVRFGNVSLTEGMCDEHKPEFEQLRQRLNNPVVKIDMFDNGVMPFFWDNDAYQWDGARLVAERAESFSTQVGFLGMTDSKPQVLTTLTNGETRTMVLKPCDPRLATTDWQVLTLQEAKIFRQCIRENEYHCPVCGTPHPASQLRCDEGGILGTPIYPTIAAMRGFILLRERSRKVQFSPHPCIALRVGEQAVAVRSGGGAEMYRFDTISGEWRKSNEHLKPYHPIGEETYAIIL